MNKVFLSGNLTRDPDVRYSQGGKAFARMGIAVNRPFSKEKTVDFFNMTAFNKTAEFCGRYMTKGTRVLVEGRLQTGSYENKDGVKVNSVEVLIDNIEFAGSKRVSSSDDSDYSEQSTSGGYSRRQYDEQPSESYQSRQPAPPKKNDFDDFGGGELLDPEDTPF